MRIIHRAYPVVAPSKSRQCLDTRLSATKYCQATALKAHFELPWRARPATLLAFLTVVESVVRPADLIRMLLLAAIWGASFLFMRIVAPVLGSMPTAFFRASLGMLGLLAILLLMRVRWDFNGKLKHCLILGLINAGLPSAMYCMAALVLPAGYSAILNATTPMMGVLIGMLFFAEAMTLSKAAGLSIGLFGVAVLTRTGPVEFDLTLLWGAAACLVATACYGFAGFLTRRWIGQQGGLDNRLTAFASLGGARLFLLPWFAGSLVVQPPASWGGLEVWLSLAGLGFICTRSEEHTSE